MRNLFKKSLAIVVALALCLTALVGAVTVNAETKTGTITSEVTVGEATVDVVFTITTDGLNEAIFSYDYDEALGVPTTIKSVNNNLEVVTAETGNLFELRDTSDNGLTDVTVGEVKFTFNKPADGTYNVTLSVHSAGASGTDEILIDIAPCTATVEIKAACEHTNKTTSEEVTKAATCTEIGYKTVTVTCNDCSEVISVTENVEIPALGHKYNYVNNGDGTHTGTCANDAEHTVTEDHNFVDGTCTACGAVEQTGPVLDENITATIGSGVSDTVYMSFIIPKSVVDVYNDFELVINRNTCDSQWNFTPAPTFTISKSDLGGSYLAVSGSNYVFYYRNTELYSLSVEITAVFYGKDSSGNIIAKSNPMGGVLTNLLKELYSKATNAKLKKVLADTLVVGEEAVRMYTKRYPTSDYYGLLETFDVGDVSSLPESSYKHSASTELEALNTVNVPYSGDTITLTLGAGLSASSYISANISQLLESEPINDSTILDYSIKFTFTNRLSTSNPTVSYTVSGSQMTKSGSRYYAYLRTLPIYSSDSDVTIEVFKGEENIGVAHYSLENYINAASSNSLISAIGRLGQSFRASRNLPSLVS